MSPSGMSLHQNCISIRCTLLLPEGQKGEMKAIHQVKGQVDLCDVCIANLLPVGFLGAYTP